MMRNRRRIMLPLTLAAALCITPGMNAMAYTDEEIEQIALDAQRALDIQAVENLMSRHVQYHCYGEHIEELEEIWVQEPENQETASFGQNQGYYVGYDAIYESYGSGHERTWLESAKSYCEENGIDISDMTDEEIVETYGGVGQLLLHVTTTAIIEVAEDGNTAKGYWYSPGMIAESGQSANSIWEAYGADFIKENGEWKMWHLHMYTDFMCAFGDTFTSTKGSSGAGGGPDTGDMQGAPHGQGIPDGKTPPEGAGPVLEKPTDALEAGTAGNQSAAGNQPDAMKDKETEEETAVEDVSGQAPDEKDAESSDTSGGQIDYEGEQGAKELAAESDYYVYSTQYSQFSMDRLRSEMEVVPIPMPYETWSFEDSNFCPTIEEYASVGVDVEDWYAVHNADDSEE